VIRGGNGEEGREVRKKRGKREIGERYGD